MSDQLVFKFALAQQISGLQTSTLLELREARKTELEMIEAELKERKVDYGSSEGEEKGPDSP